MIDTAHIRSGDAVAFTRSRSDRYFAIDGEWYFPTREGLTMGPFDSRAEAITETRRYIEFIRSATAPVIRAIKRGSFTHPKEQRNN